MTGVNLFAPTAAVRRARRLSPFCRCGASVGLGVILDVVYNHFGPVGNYLGQFSAELVSDRHRTDWGDAINFDGDNCRAGAGVHHRERRLLDRRVPRRRPAARCGSRDPRRFARPYSGRAHAACAQAAGKRGTLVFAESEHQDTRLVRRRRQRWLRNRRCLERRLSSFRAGGDDGPQRALLRRLSGIAARIDLGHQVGLPLSRPMESEASETARLTGARFAGSAIRDLFAEPRSGRQFAPRRTGSRADLARAVSGHDGADALGARNAPVVSGPGIFGIDSVLVFCRS